MEPTIPCPSSVELKFLIIFISFVMSEFYVGAISNELVKAESRHR